MCDAPGLDVWEVIDAAATKPFGFMPFYPGPGPRRALHPDRPALPVLEAQDAQLPRPLHRAGRRDQLRDARARGASAWPDALNEREKSVKGSRDPGAGRGLQARRRRRARVARARHPAAPGERGARGSATTTRTCPSCSWTGRRCARSDLMPAVRERGLVVIVTDHSAYRYREIVEAARLVLDTRNATKGSSPTRCSSSEAGPREPAQRPDAAAHLPGAGAGGRAADPHARTGLIWGRRSSAWPS